MRTKLPPRRPSINAKVVYGTLDKRSMEFFLTFGFDPEGSVKEVFCAENQFLGTDVHGVITDGCILISLYLQTGGEPEKLVQSLGLNKDLEGNPGPPSSLLGAIARALVLVQTEFQGDSLFHRSQST